MQRRRLLTAATSAATLALAPLQLRAQGAAPAAGTAGAGGFPNKPIRLIVGYTAGGPTDLTARLLASGMQSHLGQPVVVENRPGAGSNLASEMVANAPPDGYTLLVAAAPITMAQSLQKNLKWDVQKSFEPVSFLMSAPSVLAVSPNFPARNLKELIEQAKARPGKMSYGSTGMGSTPHVAGEVFKQRTGTFITHIPYKGASGALADLIAGHIDMAFMTALSALPHLKEGKIRPIAVAAPRRLPQLPDLPTMAEAGLEGFTSDSWNGLLAPAGTPAAVIDRLYGAVVKAVAQPEMRDKLTAQGAVLVGSTPAQFRSTIEREVREWQEAFKTIKVQLD
jgi:tripartite-type tricarboxylate transporter receptor subunit TctC